MSIEFPRKTDLVCIDGDSCAGEPGQHLTKARHPYRHHHQCRQQCEKTCTCFEVPFSLSLVILPRIQYVTIMADPFSFPTTSVFTNMSEYHILFCRTSSNGISSVVATRGPGTFVGEVSPYKGQSSIQWQESVRAKGSVKVMVISYPDVHGLLERWPQAYADIRASIFLA